MILKSSDELFFIQLNLKKEQYSLLQLNKNTIFLSINLKLHHEFYDFFKQIGIFYRLIILNCNL
ncbi:hypothetical protein J690_2752 [Acinetobacter sp. 742879]|nr:hypothetical protein J690_2752 [Acinetobacter sp. 742879]